MLIALYGPSRSGKDSIAGMLVRNFNFEQRNLASTIRNILLPVFDAVCPEVSAIAREEGWDKVKQLYPYSVDAMIALGQGGRDFIDKDVWLNACVNKPYSNLVIADVRQMNEANYIYKHGGELWKIEREGSQVRGMDGLLDDLEFDAVIQNNGTLEDLETIVNIIMIDRMNAED